MGRRSHSRSPRPSRPGARRGRPRPAGDRGRDRRGHCRAPTADETDWGEIASLYALLEGFRPTPGVRVNRAFALGRAKGPAAGLALLEKSDIDASAYPYVHLVRGTLLGEVGQTAAAAAALERAVRCARNEPERKQIEEKISRLARKEADRTS
jgi:RNA polymerase sigma-70 factor, ECF subfamily